MLANLVALGALAPLPIEVGFGWHTNLAGQMRDHAAGHISPSIGESPVELERFQQDGEAPTRARTDVQPEANRVPTGPK